jgi:hypothetical protein
MDLERARCLSLEENSFECGVKVIKRAKCKKL